MSGLLLLILLGLMLVLAFGFIMRRRKLKLRNRGSKFTKVVCSGMSVSKAILKLFAVAVTTYNQPLCQEALS